MTTQKMNLFYPKTMTTVEYTPKQGPSAKELYAQANKLLDDATAALKAAEEFANKHGLSLKFNHLTYIPTTETIKYLWGEDVSEEENEYDEYIQGRWCSSSDFC